MATASPCAPDQNPQSSRPQILLISLSFQPWHDEIYSRLIDLISDRAQIKRAQNRAAALRFLADTRPQAIIAADEGIAKPRNAAVLDRVVAYARSGGTVVLGMLFSSMTNQGHMDAAFARFGLPWTRGGYDRSTFTLNRAAVRGLSGLNLPPAYSQKATRVANVEPQNALYLATADSVIESRVFAPTPVERGEAAIAWAKVGEGYLGYIGDVNAEMGSDYVVMAMCGL